MHVVLLHSDAAVKPIEAVDFNVHRVELNVHIAVETEIAQGSIGACDAALVVWEILKDHDGARESRRLHLWLVVVIEMQVVGTLSLSNLLYEYGRIRRIVVRFEDGIVWVDADFVDVVFFVGQVAFFQFHGDSQRVVHEVAVYLIEDIVTAEKEIARVLHPFGDDFAFLIKFEGIVNIATIQPESSAIAHNIASDE